ncbi:MAG: hypothetical protein JXL97_13730, partial [Bacteroidales bacterium]|nr:hypothetical protein [Bacteroidales bacterium]
MKKIFLFSTFLFISFILSAQYNIDTIYSDSTFVKRIFDKTKKQKTKKRIPTIQIQQYPYHNIALLKGEKNKVYYQNTNIILNSVGYNRLWFKITMFFIIFVKSYKTGINGRYYHI